MNEYARKELLSMIQQLLLEADLSGELEAFLSSSDNSFAGIQVNWYSLAVPNLGLLKL